MKIRVILIALLCCVPYLANANEASLSQYALNRVQQANHYAQKSQYNKAIDLLLHLKLNQAYDRAYVARTLGVYYWQANNARQAIKQLQKAVDSQVLTGQQAWTSAKMLAGLLLMQHQFTKALTYYYPLTQKIPHGQNGSELWLRIAQANYQLSQWHKVLSAIEQYHVYKPANSVPDLSLKLGAQVELKQWRGAQASAKQLVALEPANVDWWRQLTAIQLQRRLFKPALNTLALARLQGVKLSQSDYHLLAQLYARGGVPLRAAQTMSELTNLKKKTSLIAQQASYWQAAKEWDKAISTWSLAAEKDPIYRWNVVQIQLQQGRYTQALLSLDKIKHSLDKIKQPKQKAKIALAKTQAYYHLERLADALKQAKLAQQLSPSEEAKSWIKYLSGLVNE